MPSLTPKTIAAVILAAAAATIGGALVFEHGFGLRPCPLCLEQRQPYYAAMVLAAILLVLPERVPWLRWGLVLLGLVFVVSTGLGIRHAGIEWGWWAGPTDCAGTPASAAGNVADFLTQLQTTRVVSCTEAAWRFLGLSLAGWNVLISAGLAALALATAWRARPAYGSSSVSQ